MIGKYADVRCTELVSTLQDANDPVELVAAPEPGRPRSPGPRLELDDHRLTESAALDQHEMRVSRPSRGSCHPTAIWVSQGTSTVHHTLCPPDNDARVATA